MNTNLLHTKGLRTVLSILFGLFFMQGVVAQEVCDDGIDNDGDGLIDCYDPDCYASEKCGFYDADYCRTILPDSKEFGMQLSNEFLAGNYQVKGAGPSYDYQPYGYAIPKVADMDNDGNMEIVVVSAYGGDDGIFIFDPINDELKYFIPLVLANNHSGVTLADVDSDPYVEIFIATGKEGTGDNKIYRYDFDGTNWNEYTNGSWPIANAHTRRGFSPDIADFNEDGTPELLFYGEQSGNKTAKIYNIATGAVLVDLIAQTGGAPGHIASHIYWKDHYAYADVIPTGFDPGTGALAYADGVEFIVGTRVYTVDLATGNVEDVWGADPTGVHEPWVNGAGGDSDAGQKVSLGDINIDGNLDVVVVGQGRISVWDPLTNLSIYDTRVLGGSSKGGVAAIGDVDGDSENRPEIGVVSGSYVEVLRANDATGELDQVWGLSNSDGSGETASNFFDFQGDGTVEMVYRDETDLWVYESAGDGLGNEKVLLTSNSAYNTANGLITDLTVCSSGTGSEHPIIVDVNKNNRAQIIVTCSEGLRVYRDRLTPWISSRSIFNQRTYNYVNINDDLTVPAVMQQNHIVPSLNNYLTQMYRIDKAGNPFFPAPDFTIEVKSIDNLCHGADNDQVDFVLNIFNYGDGHADLFEVPITFYDGDPSVAGARFLKQEIVMVDLLPLNAKETHVFDIKMTDLDAEGDGFDGNIYITINDNLDVGNDLDGSGYTTTATVLPNSPYPECDYSNNTIGPFIFQDCTLKAPLITLDKDESSHSGSLHYTDYATTYNEDGPRINISDTDVEITDDGVNITSATIEIFNPLDGESNEGLYWDASTLSSYGITTTASQGDAIVNITGTQSKADYQNAINLFQYENTSDLPNTDTRLIAVRVTDENDGLTSGSALCHITMNGVNDPPTSADKTVTTDQDTKYVSTDSDIEFNDPDGDNFHSLEISSIPAKGKLYKDANLDGTYDGSEEVSALDIITKDELYAGKLVFVPTATESGDIAIDYLYTSFDFTVYDGAAYSSPANTIEIRVLPVNEPPTAADNIVTTIEDTDYIFASAEFNFSDPDAGDALDKILLTSTPSEGKLFNDANKDGIIDAGELLSPYDEILKTAIDNNQLTFKPDADENGAPYTYFNFKVHDAIEYSTSAYKITINVTAVNDAPVAAADAITVDEGATVTVLSDGSTTSVLNNDSDADGDAITAILVSDVSNGTLTLNPDGTFSYTHDGSETTSDSFTYKVNDGTEDGNTVTVSITVNPVNDAPIANDDTGSVDEDGTLNGTTVLDNDTGLGDGGITVSLDSDVSNGTLTLNPDGTYTYVPDADFNGTDQFTYQVCDTDGDCDIATVTITVNPVNDLPVANDDTDSVDENGTLNGTTVLDNDTGLGDGGITVTLDTDVSNGTLTLNTDGTYTYVPNPNFNGTDEFTYQVCDTDGDCDIATVTITVIPVLSADLVISKTVDNATANVGEDVTFTITVTNNGPSDATGVAVSDQLPSGYTYVSDNSGGSYDSGTGVWTIGNLANGANASLEITATVNASGDYTNTATASANENDPTSSNDEDDATVTPGAVSDLSLTKTVDNATANVDDNVIFTISVTNNGPSDATGTAVTDQLPSGYTYVSDNSSGTYDSGTGVWTVGNLANGANASLEITATVNANGDYTNTATASANENDPTSSNDEDDAAVTPGADDSESDLSVSKTVDNNKPVAGDEIQFTIIVTNNGPDAAENVIVTDILPDGYSLVNTVVSEGEWNEPEWMINILENGDSENLVMTVRVEAQGEYENTASVESESFDPDSFNNSDKEIITLNRTVTVPEGFSPNNDGFNDRFEIPGLDAYPENHVIIMNRWGNKVYEASPYLNDWDGTNMFGVSVGGSELPAGTYFYIIELGDDSKPVKGFIYLSR
jgi:uncharacterized repeat protein (TIGR01451 family)/gliding motility-associated-like protein